jgi:hypothetical protein
MHTFEFNSLENLFNTSEEEHEWVIEGLAPAGALSLLAAKPKVGKSTLARNLSLAVATGQPVIGRETVQGAVINLALEEKSSEVARHYKAMGALGNEPIFVHVGMAPRDPMIALEQALREHHPSLVTIDPMQRFLRLREIKDYSEVSREFEPLVELAREFNTHIMLLHHIKKGELLSGLSDGFIGSTAIFGSVDVGIIMQKKDEARTIQTDGPQRFDVDIPETVLTFNAESGLVSAGLRLTVVRQHELEQRVIDKIGDMNLKMDDIKKAVGGDNTKTHDAVMALYKEGLLERQGEGIANKPYLFSVTKPPVEAKPNGSGPHDARRDQVDQATREYMDQRAANPMFKDLPD